MPKVSAKDQIFTHIIAAGMLLAQVVLAQSPVVVVREVEFRGDLGLPAGELQEYTEFLKRHALEDEKVLKQSSKAVTTDLRHPGFWKADVAPSLHRLKSSGDAAKDVVLEVTIHAGLQYRVKDVTFSGLASEFPARELREAFPLRPGDVADLNAVETGIAKRYTSFKSRG